MATKKQLLLATNNPGKIRELKEILADLVEIDLLTPMDFGITLEVVEFGSTYAENAALKARAFAQTSGVTTLADDSGLEVDALEGAPGLHSARYSPKVGATDADRRAFLLDNLEDKPRPWTARFRCMVAIMVPGRRPEEVQFAEGVCEGEIVTEERGSGGFGYDPIFLLAGSDRTMAELEGSEKNRVSHRARAVRAAFPILGEVFEI